MAHRITKLVPSSVRVFPEVKATSAVLYSRVGSTSYSQSNRGSLSTIPLVTMVLETHQCSSQLDLQIQRNLEILDATLHLSYKEGIKNGEQTSCLSAEKKLTSSGRFTMKHHLPEKEKNKTVLNTIQPDEDKL